MEVFFSTASMIPVTAAISQKMRNKLTIWRPKQLAPTEPTASNTANLLFGWFFSCSSVSVDVVVAFACNEASFSHTNSTLQEILGGINGKMAMLLQERATFSLLGQCALYDRGNGKMSRDGMEDGDWRNSVNDGVDSMMNCKESFEESNGGRSCGCDKPDGLFQKCRKDSVKNGLWIRLVYDFCEEYDTDIDWVPKLHHLHWNGQIVSHCDIHVCNSL